MALRFDDTDADSDVLRYALVGAHAEIEWMRLDLTDATARARVHHEAVTGERDALRAECDELRGAKARAESAEHASAVLAAECDRLVAERDRLRAELDAFKATQPSGWTRYPDLWAHPDGRYVIRYGDRWEGSVDPETGRYHAADSAEHVARLSGWGDFPGVTGPVQSGAIAEITALKAAPSGWIRIGDWAWANPDGRMLGREERDPGVWKWSADDGHTTRWGKDTAEEAASCMGWTDFPDVTEPAASPPRSQAP